MKNKNLKRVGAYIDPELYAEVNYLSKKTGHSIATMIRWGLGGVVSDHRSQGDLDGFKGGKA